MIHRFAFVAWCAACLALSVAPVRTVDAATLTFSDPNCINFEMSETPPSSGNYAVTCNLLTTPVCQLTANTLTPAINTPVTLTASCNRSPTSWAFSGGNAASCPTSQSTCSDTQTATGAVTYKVTASNGAGAGPEATVTVNWQVAAPLAAPSGCTLSANPSSLPAGGGTTALSVSCAGGGAPTTYAWTGGTLSTTPNTTPSQSTNMTSTTTFTVTPSNGTGAGNVASATVTVAGTSSAGDLCSSYSQVTIIDVPWGGQKISGGSGSSFAKAGVLVARFTVPAAYASVSGSKGRIEYAEYVDPAAFRQASLSNKACDFRGVASTYSTGAVTDKYKVDLTATNYPYVWAISNSGSASFTVTGTALSTAQLVPGQTYYLNLRNYSPYLNGGKGGVSCATSTCNVVVRIATP